MRAIDRSLASCHTCGLLMRLAPGKHAHCPRCGDAVHLRKSNSIRNTWALLLSAIAMYLPANVLPIMTVVSLGNTQSDTIMSGVIYFLKHGDWPLALIIFTASVLVPLLKMIALVYLLLSVQRRSPLRKNQRTRLYRVTELKASQVARMLIPCPAALGLVATTPLFPDFSEDLIQCILSYGSFCFCSDRLGQGAVRFDLFLDIAPFHEVFDEVVL